MRSKRRLLATIIGILFVAVVISVLIPKVRAVFFADLHDDDMEQTGVASTDSVLDLAMAEPETQNQVLKFFHDKYDGMFRLWGPEEQSLYVFYIYPDHAERECHILMPANTDDVSEYHRDLTWKVVDDELRITGEWQEAFTIDIAMETATSAATGKVYQICEMQPPLE